MRKSIASKKSGTPSKKSQNSSGKEVSTVNSDPYDLTEFDNLGAPGNIGDFDPGIESASIALDYAMGGVGVPRGRFTMIEGNTDYGKTTLAMLYGISAVQAGLKVLVINREGRWNIPYAKESGMGLPGQDYLLIYPKDAESSCESIRLAAKRKFDVCILESIAALAPAAEINGDFRDANIGVLSRILSKFFRDAVLEVAASGMAVIMTNQLRDKIGVMYGSPDTAPGGRAKDFNASVTIRLQQPIRKYMYGTKDDKHEVSGMEIVGKTRKSFGINHRKVSCEVMFVPGLVVDKPNELMDFGLRLRMYKMGNGEIKESKAGSWVYGDINMGSTNDTKKYLATNPEVAQDIEMNIRSVIRTGASVQPLKDEEE